MRARLIAVLLVAVVGCDASEAGPWRPGPGSRTPGSDGGTFVIAPPPRETPRCDEAIGEPMVRRLTTTQLSNTLEDLFGSPDVPQMRGMTDPVVRGYDADAKTAVIRDLGAQQLMQHAEAVAAWAIEHRLGALTTCTDNNAICRVQFIRAVGRRLYRAPMSDETLLGYDTVFEADRAFDEGAEVVLRTMLQSPHFLYRMEVGEPVEGEPDLVQLTPHELATALAFLATNSGPDDALLDAAGAGRLRTDEDLDRELDRLLESPRAPEALARFARQWLAVDQLPARPKDPAVGELTDAMRASMLRETDALYLDAFHEGGGLSALFLADHTFVDGPLAAYYGLEGVDGATLDRVELTGTDRAPGLLGHASVLATHARADGSSPTQRGVMVRRRLLCEDLPPPPPNVDTTLEPIVGAVTTRERYEQHSANEACAGCHERVDPIGFALERFDGFGRYRVEENGAPIDATGVVIGTPDGDAPLDGAESLAAFLAESPEVRACFAESLAYYTYGVEGCTYADLTDDLTADTPIRELMRRLVHTRHFRFRRVTGD